MYVAARRFLQEPTLLSELVVSIDKLVGAEINRTPPSIHTVKGFLLLIAWPLPLTYEFHDKSAILVGVVMQTARKLGLHAPWDEQYFRWTESRPSPETVREMVKVWSVCNITAHSYAATSGNQSLFVDGWILNQACHSESQVTLPNELRHRAIIVRQVERGLWQLSNNAADPGGVAFERERIQIIHQLETDMDSLIHSLGAAFNRMTYLYYYAARLYVQSYYFFDLADVEVWRAGLLKVYETATLYLQTVLDEDKSTDLMLYAPSDILRTMWLAMSIISTVLGSACGQHANFEAGQRLFHGSLAGARKASVENNDLIGRLSVVMAQLWRKKNAKRAPIVDEPRLRLKSCLSMSVCYDWFGGWREMFLGERFAHQEPPAPIPLSMQQTMLEEHPSFNLGINNQFFPPDSDGMDWLWTLGGNVALLGDWDMPLPQPG